jgi:UDP-glucuronate decarboxylase
MTRNELIEFSPGTRARLVDSSLDVVVTGGTGWLGRATLEMLDTGLGPRGARRVHVFASQPRTLELRSGRAVEVRPLAELADLRIGTHLLAHFAFATREKVAGLGVSEYIARNVRVTELVTQFAQRQRPAGAFMVSSGAVYFPGDLATNPYGVLKAREEAQFMGLAHGSATAPARVVVPRLFNLAGPFITKPELFVLGCIIGDVARGGPIRLHANHSVIRSYVHVRDLIELAFAMMLGAGPLPAEPFDTVGEREVEVGELALLAANVLGRPDMEIVRPPVEEARTDRYVGNPAVIRGLFDSHGVDALTLPRQIEDTARYMWG